MITLHGLHESGVELNDEVGDGVRYFSKCLNKLQNKDKKVHNWAQERECFIKCWTKLTSDSKEAMPEISHTFSSLNVAVAEVINNNEFPAILAPKQHPKTVVAAPEPEVQEEPCCDHEVPDENTQTQEEVKGEEAAPE